MVAVACFLPGQAKDLSVLEKCVYKRMKKSVVEKQFHAKSSGYSLISYLHRTYKSRKCRQARLSAISVNTLFKKVIIN